MGLARFKDFEVYAINGNKAGFRKIGCINHRHCFLRYWLLQKFGRAWVVLLLVRQFVSQNLNRLFAMRGV